MRKAILAIILGLILVTGELHAATPKKAPKADVGSGRVAWFDITTTSMPRSRISTGSSSTGNLPRSRARIWPSRSSRVARRSGRCASRRAKSPPSTEWCMSRCPTSKLVARKRRSWGEQSHLASPSTCRTASEPSPWSSIQRATRLASTREPRSLRSPLRPSEELSASPSSPRIWNASGFLVRPDTSPVGLGSGISDLWPGPSRRKG